MRPRPRFARYPVPICPERHATEKRQHLFERCVGHAQLRDLSAVTLSRLAPPCRWRLACTLLAFLAEQARRRRWPSTERLKILSRKLDNEDEDDDDSEPDDDDEEQWEGQGLRFNVETLLEDLF